MGITAKKLQFQMSEAVVRRTSSRKQKYAEKVAVKADMMDVDEAFDKENVENEKMKDDAEEGFDIKISPTKEVPKRVGRAKKIAFDSSSIGGQIIFGTNLSSILI